MEPCDVRDDAAVKAVFDRWGAEVGGLDILVHALAFANREDLEGAFVDTSRDGFALALDVSAYSLVALAREARPHLRPGASILTLTYYGAEKVVAHYNVMGVAKAALEACVRYLAADLGPSGVRVNAISAGPVRTLAAHGIAGFKDDVRRHSATWRRCARTSRSRTSPGPRSGWPATSPARSPARRSTSTAASTSSGCRRRRVDAGSGVVTRPPELASRQEPGRPWLPSPGGRQAGAALPSPPARPRSARRTGPGSPPGREEDDRPVRPESGGSATSPASAFPE